MKARYLVLFVGLLMLLAIPKSQSILNHPPTTVNVVKEIALIYPQRLAKLYQSLTPQERVFNYYMFRASLPGNRIATDQNHRDAIAIQEMLEFILEHKDALPKENEKFLEEVTNYLIYLWTNHGHYFMREHANQKRTPERLGFAALNQKSLAAALEDLGYPDAQAGVDAIADSMFNVMNEPTLTVPGSIDQSATNMYARDFSDVDFAKLAPEDQQRLNSYCFVEEIDGVRTPRCAPLKIGGKYDAELQMSLHWLQKALAHARNFPEQFDAYFIESLEYLCAFIESGDEEMFKKHSIAWLKSNSRLDYCWGFIETYEDPKGYRGSFQAEVTIKSLDINTLNAILPRIEAGLPFPAEFKRDNLLSGNATLPNASINTKIFAVGNLGPLNITAAYCLPNYQEIRSAHGSKQIIYHIDKGIGELLNADLYNQLFHLPDQYVWLQKHDPEFALDRDIFNLECILHETLGHGSGKFTTHVFQEGDNFAIDGNTYVVGDEIPVTSGNIEQFLAGYAATLEELRAEIIALLAAITNYDELAVSGIMGEWPQKIEKNKMIELLINAMAQRGLSRLILQQEGATEVAGDHARANTTIMNYLVDHGGIAFAQEKIMVKGKPYTVLGTQVVDRARAMEGVKELAVLVQKIHSTGDTQGVRNLIETYGKPIRHPEHLRIMQENMRACVGDVKVSGSLYPDFYPIVDDATGEIVDAVARWPKDIVEQFMKYSSIQFAR
jgi:dipeptidyl-peptidase III